MAENTKNPIKGPAGPGKYAKRTDIPSSGYGEGVATKAIQQGAPMAKTRGAGDPKLGRPSNALTNIVPLDAPTQRPEEAITTGVDIGPGPGSQVLGMQMGNVKLSDTLAKMLPYDPTGDTAALYQQLLARGL